MSTQRTAALEVANQPLAVLQRPTLVAPPRLAILRTPLFHKILLAAVAAVFLATAGCAVLALKVAGLGSGVSALPVALLVATVATAIAVPIYGSVLRIALTPLGILEHTAERVEQGELSARAEISDLADPRMERLTRVFNRMLDSTAADRERLREVAARAFGAQEAERMRIARELNEETAQTLATLLLRIGAARRAEEAPVREKMLDALWDDLVELTDRVRGFARALYPPTLKQLGVAAAIGAYARAVSESTDLEVECTTEDIPGLLAPEAESALYRIVQDALSNVVRHAGATRVRIQVAPSARGGVEVCVEDDGVGFRPEDVLARNACIGLLGRTRSLRGRHRGRGECAGTGNTGPRPVSRREQLGGGVHPCPPVHQDRGRVFSAWAVLLGGAGQAVGILVYFWMMWGASARPEVTCGVRRTSGFEVHPIVFSGVILHSQ